MGYLGSEFEWLLRCELVVCVDCFVGDSGWLLGLCDGGFGFGLLDIVFDCCFGCCMDFLVAIFLDWGFVCGLLLWVSGFGYGWGVCVVVARLGVVAWWVIARAGVLDLVWVVWLLV